MRYRVKIVKRATGYDWELQRGIPSEVHTALEGHVLPGFDDWESVGWGERHATEEAAIKEATKLRDYLEAEREAEEAAHYVELA